MGMFDTLVFAEPIACVQCGTPIPSTQTKSLGSTLESYRVGDVVWNAFEPVDEAWLDEMSSLMADKETDRLTSYATTFIESAGTQTKLALRIARHYGCVLESTLPMSGKLSSLSTGAFYTRAAKYRIASYHNLRRNLAAPPGRPRDRRAPCPADTPPTRRACASPAPKRCARRAAVLFPIVQRAMAALLPS